MGLALPALPPLGPSIRFPVLAPPGSGSPQGWAACPANGWRSRQANGLFDCWGELRQSCVCMGGVHALPWRHRRSSLLRISPKSDYTTWGYGILARTAFARAAPTVLRTVGLPPERVLSPAAVRWCWAGGITRRGRGTDIGAWRRLQRCDSPTVGQQGQEGSRSKPRSPEPPDRGRHG